MEREREGLGLQRERYGGTNYLCIMPTLLKYFFTSAHTSLFLPFYYGEICKNAISIFILFDN